MDSIVSWLRKPTLRLPDAAKLLSAVKAVTRPNHALNGTAPFVCTGVFVWALFQGFHWGWWLAAYGFHAFYYGMGPAIGNHRYWSHKSFETSLFWERIMLLAAALGSQSSALGMASTHAAHHAFADQAGDPHSPWRACFKLLFPLTYDGDVRTVRRLLRRGDVVAFHEWKNAILAAWLLLLAAIDLRALLFFWVIPFAWASITVLLQVSVVHAFGYRNHDTADRSTNVWWLLPLSFGEGWHNNHHRHPVRWCAGERWWEIDPCGWVIRLIKK
jgi:fatty-acid desaturase